MTHDERGEKPRAGDTFEHSHSDDGTKEMRKANEKIRKSQGDDSAIGRTGNRPAFDRDGVVVALVEPHRHRQVNHESLGPTPRDIETEILFPLMRICSSDPERLAPHDGLTDIDRQVRRQDYNRLGPAR